MADRIVYIDGVGAGADEYVSLNAAFAGEDGYDCVSNTGDLIFECENIEDTTILTTSALTGFTTSATYGLIVRAADNHGGKWSTGAYRLNLSGGAYSNAILLNAQRVQHLRFEGIQIRLASTITGSTHAVEVTGVGATGYIFEMDKCIIVCVDDSDTVCYGLQLWENAMYHKLSNCVIYGSGVNATSAGIDVHNNAQHLFLYNCTIDGFGGAGLYSATNLNNVRSKNSRITGCGSVATHSLHADSDYNLTDGTAPTNWGTNSIDSTDTPTIDYVDDTNATLTSRDYHLNSTSDSGYQAGTDLSSDTDLSFTDDIDGDTRG